MRYLLDTCFLSELRRPHPDLGVLEFFEGVSPELLFVSIITLGELQRGIELLDEGRKKRSLHLWLGQLEESYGANIVTADAETARIWGVVTANCQKGGRPINVSDGWMAAIALQHGFHLVTRNVKDFEMAGPRLDNPWRGP